MLKLYKSVSATVSDVDEVKGIVSGYFAHFDSIDTDGDIIQKGAFKKTVSENGPAARNRIKHFLNHDTGRPIGTLLELGEDAVGLKYVSQLWKGTPDADLVIVGAQHKSNFEHSIGYRTVKEDRKSEANYLQELGLYEGSTLTFYGANSNTPLTGLKAVSDLQAAFSVLEKALRTGNWQDETYLLIQEKYDQIGQLLKPQTKAPNTERGLSGLEKRERDFLMEMIPHHEMALKMASKVTDSQRLKTFAENLIETQTGEIDQMTRWLKNWFNASNGAPMKSHTTEPGKPTQPDGKAAASLFAAFTKSLQNQL